MGFKYKTILEQRMLVLEELEEYYRQLRKYEYEQNIPIKGIEIKKKINNLVIPFFKTDRLVKGQSLSILKDDRIYSNKSKIYVVTHIGRYDIEMAMESIKDSCYLVMGDPGRTYINFEGMLLNTIGVVFFDTKDQLDRKIAQENCIKILDQGGTIFIFSEGAWNTTENEIVTKLYNGSIEMGRPTEARPEGSEIVPIAIEQYGMKYYSVIGESIDISSQLDKTNREIADSLRDVLCTLKFYIWQTFSITQRKSFPRNYSDIYITNIMAESSDEYTLTEIERTRYKDKSVTTPQEAFSFLEKLNPCKENAFLSKEILAYKNEQTLQESPLSVKEAVQYAKNLFPTKSNALLLMEVTTFIKNKPISKGNIVFLNEVLTFLKKLDNSKEKVILLREVSSFLKKIEFSKEKVLLLNEVSLIIMEIKNYHKQSIEQKKIKVKK